MIRTVFYFVDDIDTSFVLNDIRKFAYHTDELIIISTEAIERKYILPSNVRIIDEYINWSNFRPIIILLKNFFTILKIYAGESIRTGKLIKPKQALATICSNIYKAQEALRVIGISKNSDSKNNLFIAFWFYDCIYLAFIKKWGRADKAICRAHGGDLFEERSSLKGKTLFRNFQLKYLNNVFSVSETGSEYLKRKYPVYAQKIMTSYLGSSFHEDINPLDLNHFTIVSCANIRDIKRIHLIAEALLHIDIVLHWIHIGDENINAKSDPSIALYLKAINKLKLKKNIKFTNKGHMVNDKIFKLFKENPINLFISVSSAEGIPVSMMEAISFGIPVLSTDVGGCKEIVCEETGILMPADASPQLIQNKILEFHNSKMNTEEFRRRVRQYWEKYFNEDINYYNFINQING